MDNGEEIIKDGGTKNRDMSVTAKRAIDGYSEQGTEMEERLARATKRRETDGGAMEEGTIRNDQEVKKIGEVLTGSMGVEVKKAPIETPKEKERREMRDIDLRLFNAVYENDIEGAGEALKKGADINVPDAFGMTVIDVANLLRFAEIKKMLLEKEGEKIKEALTKLINKREREGIIIKKGETTGGRMIATKVSSPFAPFQKLGKAMNEMGIIEAVKTVIMRIGKEIQFSDNEVLNERMKKLVNLIGKIEENSPKGAKSYEVIERKGEIFRLTTETCEDFPEEEKRIRCKVADELAKKIRI